MNKNVKSYLSDRIFAGIIDYSIIYIFKFCLLLIVGQDDGTGNAKIIGLLALTPVLFWFLMTVVYEQRYGKTLGNSLMKLQPISINGETETLTFTQSLKRHLLDPIDMFFFGIGIFMIRKTDMNQRLGDLWAKTTVISIRQ